MTEDELTREIEAFVTEGKVPGAAVSIVQDGRPTYRRCFGVMSLDDRRSVEFHSTFDIGSVSKTFNAAAVGILVDEGKLSWDDRAVDLLPGFELSDPWVTSQVTLRDLLGQRIGLGEDSVTNYWSRYSRAELVAQMKYLPLRAPFRTECAYQQYSPTVAGTIVERVSGLSWEDFIRRRVAEPLGMGDTYGSYFRLPDRSVACAPHADLGNGIVAIPHRDFTCHAPAGGVVSSLRDLETWAAVFAGDGSHNGHRLLKPETVVEMQRAAILWNPSGLRPQVCENHYAANVVAYGLGWMIFDHVGYRVVEHSGALEGFIALVAAVPSERLGVVVLTNLHRTPIPHGLRYLLLSHALGLEQQDWRKLTRELVPTGPRKTRVVDGEPYFWRPMDRIANTKPSVPLNALAGLYLHPGFGELPVLVENGKLVADICGLVVDSEHWHYDLFRGVPREPALRLYHPEIFFRFEIDPRGGFNRLVVPTIGEFRREGTA